MKVAIIGTGISGLGAAYLLNQHHDIALYEKNSYIGGHSRTIEIDDGVAVDTGFIVFNHKNYPLLTGLFKHLDVETAKSNMSFGVSINNGWLEYGTFHRLAIFAQKSNFFHPKFWRMIKDILRFNKNAAQYLDKDITLGQCLDEMKMSQWFKDYYLLAMGGAIWSMPLEQMLAFPAKTFLRFFDNHGLLTVNDQPQWHSVVGGSREYVKKITASFKDKIKLDCGITAVTRVPSGVEIKDVRGETVIYDQVIFACHSDQALSLLQNPTKDEQDILGAIKYQPNEAVLHQDTSFMPKRKKAWSSWVYLSEAPKDNNPNVSLSYWMNNLQVLDMKKPIIVTLNPGRDPNPDLVYNRHKFEHPVFDQAAIAAQNRITDIQGVDKIYYCGAWQRYGFHEDGLLSAVNVAKLLGIDIPWK